ncbi:MAG: Crp/Fnr family transcriptional regulator [Bacteroidota bacterium]
MNPLKEQLLKHHPSFSAESIEKGLSLFKQKQFKAKSHILHAGETSDKLFFAESSITRCHFLDASGNEQTLWMKPEKTFITEYKGFSTGIPSQFSLQFYEDTNVFYISRKDLIQLYQQSTDWALFGIHLTEQVHVTLIDVFVNLLSNDATDNYRYIEYAFPRFIQVAPLKDIASMLQVSQVTLSRIRSGKQLKS